jgi:hypothetical protein
MHLIVCWNLGTPTKWFFFFYYKSDPVFIFLRFQYYIHSICSDLNLDYSDGGGVNIIVKKVKEREFNDNIV